MSKKGKLTKAAATADRSAPLPATAPVDPAPISAEDQMRDTTDAISHDPNTTTSRPTPDAPATATAPPSAAGSDITMDQLLDAGDAGVMAASVAINEALSHVDDADPGPVPDDVDLGAVTADRYRLILALERAAIRGHGLDSDRALHMEAATMIRSLLDLAPDADLTEPYVVGPVVNDPPIGHSL